MEKEVLGKNIDKIITFASYRMSLSARKLIQKKLKESNFEITPEQWGIIIIVFHNEGISQAELAGRLFKQGPNVTRIIDEVEKSGFIKRVSVENDRRKYSVYLTDKGKNVVETFIPVCINLYKEITNGLSCEEVELSVNVINKVFENIEQILKK